MSRYGWEDLGEICRLRRWLEPDLAARSCRLLSPGELDQLGACVADVAPAGGHRACHEAHQRLLRPAASRREPWVFQMLNQGIERYLQAVPVVERAAAQHSLISAFATTDPETVATAAMPRYLTRIEHLACQHLHLRISCPT